MLTVGVAREVKWEEAGRERGGGAWLATHFIY